jgi:hypothetical protein
LIADVQATTGEGVAAGRTKPDTMSDHETSRTLVKSAPELWAECSDAASLAKHLGAFGEIRITKLEPETAVVWEGEAARGTVRLEPSGWGTRVVLTADSATPAPEPSVEPEAQADEQAEPEVDVVEVPAAAHRGLLSRVFFRWPRRGRAAPPASATGPESDSESAPQPTPVDAAGQATRDALDAALDSLGSAHHRPYSRA